MATSMPGISASGNMTPQSMAIAVSPCSRTRRLRPISPSPPSGITRSAAPAPLPPLIARPRAAERAARALRKDDHRHAFLHLRAGGAQARDRLRVIAAVDDDVPGVPEGPAEDRHARQLD